MVSERTVPIKFQAIYQGAMHGMNKVSGKLAQINQQVRQNSVLNAGLQRVDRMTSRMSNVGGIGQLNKQMATGTSNMKAYGGQVNTFSRQLKGMSSIATMSTREIKSLTTQFDKFSSGVNAYQNLQPSFVKERGAGSRFTGRQYYTYQVGDTGAPITGMPMVDLPRGVAGSKKAVEATMLRNVEGMKYFGGRLTTFADEFATVARVIPDALGDTNLSRVMEAFKDPSKIEIQRMTSGKGKGMYSLMSGGQPVVGTPWLRTEKEAELFRNAASGMTKSLKETTATQEKMNRRQGVSFMNLLGLMVKFGIAMELIQAPGRLIQYGKETIGQAGRLFQGVSEISTLVPGINRENQAPIASQFSDIAARTRAGGVEPAAKVGSVARVIASSLETIPHGDPRTIGGTSFDAETATLLDMTEQVIKTAGSALETDYEAVARAMSRYAGAFRVTPSDPRMTRYSDLFTATVDVGDVSGANVAAFGGEIAGIVSAIWGSEDAERADRAFKEMHMLYATASTTLSPEVSATGIRNIFNKARRPSAGMHKYLTELKDVTTAHPDLPTVDLGAGALRRLGPLDWFREINKHLGMQGSVTNKLIESEWGQNKITGELDYHGGDIAAAEENVRSQISMALLNPMLENIRGVKGFYAIMIDDGGKLEKLASSLDNLTKEMGIADKRFVQAKTTEPASKDALNAMRQQARRGGLDPTEIAEHNLRKTRDLQDMVEGHPGTYSTIGSILHMINPVNFLPRAMNISEEFGRINKMLSQGVAPKDIHKQYMEDYGSVPYGLEPGKQGFWNYIQDIDPSRLEGGHRVQSYNELLSQYNELKKWNPESRQDVSDYYYDLPSILPNEGQTSGHLTNDIDINVTLQGSKVSTEEDAQQVGDAVVNEISKLLGLESYPDTSLSNLHRNTGVT